MVLKLDVTPTGHGKGAQTPKGRERRDLIIKTAARLFAERGFDSVSISDIGYESGVTGPAIYRYFPSKEALLISIYVNLYSASSGNIDRIVRDTPEGAEQVVALIDGQLTLAIEQSEAIRIVESEWRNLPGKEAADLQRVSQQGLKAWIEAIRRSRPDLDVRLAEVTAHAVLAMINSISRRRSSKVLTAAQRDRLREMAIASVFGQPTPPTTPARSRRRAR